MTQIISYVESQRVFLAADRRLTLLDGSLHDDHVNKCVLYDGRVVFAFTGLAKLDSLPVHEWLTGALSSAAGSELRGACETVAQLGTQSIRRLRGVPARAREVTIVGAGWSRLSDGLVPIRVRISNRNAAGVLLPAMEAAFRVGNTHRRSVSVEVDGCPIPADKFEVLKAVMKHHRRRRSPAEAVSRALVSAIRRTADNDVRVGRRVLTASIPKSAVANSTGVVLVGPNPPDTAVSFSYWEDGLWNGISYGPSAVSSTGSAMTHITTGPILPPLGALIDRGPAGIQLRYPIAVLRLPDGGFANITNPGGGKALLAYADEAAMDRMVRSRLPDAAAIHLQTTLELDDLVRALRDPVEAVLFDVEPPSYRPRAVLTPGEIHARRVERFGS